MPPRRKSHNDREYQPAERVRCCTGRATAPADGVVLGGLERVKQALVNGAVEQRIDALLDAFQYGQLGLDLVIQALDDKSEKVQEAAYWLLQDSTEPRVKLALQAYNPYLFFECLCTTHMGPVRTLALSPERKTLVSVDVDTNTIKEWNLQTQQIIHTFEFDKTRSVIYAAITPDAQILVIANSGDFVEVWELQTGRKISTTTYSADSFASVVISSDGQTFANNGNSDDPDYIDFTLWDVWTGRAISGIEMHKPYRGVQPLGTNEQILITSHYDNNNIILWDWKLGQLIRMLKGHSAYVYSAVISSDERFLISGSLDKTIMVWNLQTGHELSTLTGHSSSVTRIAVSLDGQILVSGYEDGTVKVWGLS